MARTCDTLIRGSTATRRTIHYRSIIGAMEKPIHPPTMPRKRGNPNWGRVLPFPPAAATEFEMQVRQLGMTTQTCAASMVSAMTAPPDRRFVAQLSQEVLPTVHRI